MVDRNRDKDERKRRLIREWRAIVKDILPLLGPKGTWRASIGKDNGIAELSGPAFDIRIKYGLLAGPFEDTWIGVYAGPIRTATGSVPVTVTPLVIAEVIGDLLRESWRFCDHVNAHRDLIVKEVGK